MTPGSRCSGCPACWGRSHGPAWKIFECFRKIFECSLKIFNINLGHERVVLGGEDEVLGLVDEVADLVNLLPREAVKHLDRVHSQVRPAEKIRLGIMMIT